MQRWRGLEATPADLGRTVVTVGMYDGVHRGHQQLISTAVARARAMRRPCLLVTFDPHPSEVVRPGSHPAILTSADRKAELIADLGVDAMCVVPFTPEFSRLSPETFAHTVLVEHLHAAGVVVGANFSYGHGAAGNVTTLTAEGRRFGFSVEGVGLSTDSSTDGEVTISSTYIRACVAAGDMVPASRALGRPHRVDGVVVRGEQRGRELGYPTANVESARNTAIPADGVYAGTLVLRGRSGESLQSHPAAVSVGTNPTFSGTRRTVEAFLLDWSGDLYGEHVGVEFVERLRPMTAFAGIDELLVAMAQDVADTRAVLGL
ncbi:bifunctional riboflavin kinase/FAD synthetase [Modestobacter sp. I12A-02628]|uniref:Riboflavin biosynthesis protein n=1 Tax=Goekera deserti TaxID=2497753 RepID=A0A7K3WHI0_9ACTN|nr:bifunctional riboflavin kinase/FAD synthetase [Goekera deserti]MPQ97222.1 bifunctional riboflavin kinase/FAD synthetase [Goekera deserti]NDI50268.1 bifunctional riboflavin kinase/FAD synthetase [Goekera deserti]NEL55836.1 bifunctional riboflavin kinase/FAD synthetase [Goekera deserti]